MNQSYKDIITMIQRHGPITTSEVCEHLSQLGYGGAMKWQDYRDTVAKQLSYLKTLRAVTGEDLPQPKGKPLRYWSLATTEEMASDVAEIEAITEGSSVTETTTPEPVSVSIKSAHKPRLSAEQLIQGYKDAGSQGNMLVFAAGVAFAEKHHGIG